MQERKNQYRMREAAEVFGASGGACCRRADQGGLEQGNKRDAELLELIREMAADRHLRQGRQRVRKARRDD